MIKYQNFILKIITEYYSIFKISINYLFFQLVILILIYMARELKKVRLLILK